MPVTPDPIVCTRQLLLTMPGVTSRVANRISPRLQGPQPQIRLAGAGGQVGPHPGQARPRVQVECWGPGGLGAAAGSPVDDGSAAALAFAVLDELPTGTVTLPAGVVVDAYPDGLPFASDDPSTGRARWILPLRLDLHPL